MDEIKMKIENNIVDFVQNIVDCEWSAKNEYLQFIYAENIDTDALISSLNAARLIHKLYILSKEIIEKNGIKPNSSKYQPFTKDSLLIRIQEMQADIDKILKKLKSTYDESFDIDDDEEYLKIQKKVREKRKKVHELKQLCKSYCEAIEKYELFVLNSSVQNSSSEVPATEINSKNTAEANESSSGELAEQRFADWLVKYGNVAEVTAKQYISNIHSIEKLGQKVFGIKTCFLGNISKNQANEIIELLIKESEYIEANERRHNGFNAALTKYIQFANIEIDGFKTKNEQSPVKKTVPKTLSDFKIVDFDFPQNYKHYKPISFKFDGSVYAANSWKKLYELFLKCICYDDRYANLMKNQIGKSLYGKSIDFADDKSFTKLRRPINISPNFYAEGNLSSDKIIRYIKKLMELCSIDSSRMIIEYDDTIKAPQDETDEETESLDLQENETNIDSSLLDEKDGKIEKIILELNGNTVDVYDCNDAWQKICEFAVRCKPFTMTYIFKSEINLNEKKLFYRQPAPIEGYSRLSNNLQVLKVENYSELKITVEKLKKYCDLDDSMITIKEI